MHKQVLYSERTNRILNSPSRERKEEREEREKRIASIDLVCQPQQMPILVCDNDDDNDNRFVVIISVMGNIEETPLLTSTTDWIVF